MKLLVNFKHILLAAIPSMADKCHKLKSLFQEENYATIFTYSLQVPLPTGATEYLVSKS